MSCFCIRRVWKKTVGRWQEQISRIMHRLKMMPESYPFVPELQKWRKYRGAIIMKNFKIIYFYNEKKKYDLTADQVIRHYDVTGKICPKYFVEDEDAWVEFRRNVQDALEKQ